MSTVSEDARKYELMVIVDPDIGEKAIKEHFDKLRKHIAALKGEVFYEDDWGLRNLAYQIKKRNNGYYMIFDLLLEPEHIQEFDRKLRLDTEVLRHMLTVLSAHYKPQSYANVEEIEEEKEKPPTAAWGQKLAAGRFLKEKTEKVEIKKTDEVEIKKSLPDIDSGAAVKESEPEKVPENKKISKKAQKESLENIDEKLSRLLDNPDINL